MLVLTLIYVLVLIYVAICVFSTDLLFIGKKLKHAFTNRAGVKVYNKIENYLDEFPCTDVSKCYENFSYYNQHQMRIKRKLHKTGQDD